LTFNIGLLYKKFNRFLRKYYQIIIPLLPPLHATPGRVGMEAAIELSPFFQPSPEGQGC